MTDLVPIRRALLSVSDKAGLEPLAAALVARGATARVEAVDAELAALGAVDAPPVAAPVEQPKRAPRQTRT